jgi:Na+/proline symporter/nitrogen-specific signal transduction histidine kinase
MTLSANLVIFTAVAYISLLFVLAFVSDKRARQGKDKFLRSPFVYTLSISVYCTSWTFYGSVGSAARNNFEYLAIYLGPTLIFIGWWFLLRKLVRIGRRQRITSVADFLSSRFGKSSRLAVLVTFIAVVVTTPYIALQLKAITTSIQVMSAAGKPGTELGIGNIGLGFAVAACMALFTILFGTRNVDAKEQHHGVVAAIAFEAIVKLVALLAVGVFVVFGVGGGPAAIYAGAQEIGIDVFEDNVFGPRWIAILILSAGAVLCLPRQFQITVVENSNEKHLQTASWAFPTYLLLMSLFTMPIALYGLTVLPAGSNPDMFVLTLPLSSGNPSLALFAFIGGFSSATSMIIVATIALSIMISNHIVMPIALRSSKTLGSGDGRGVTQLLLTTRRASIALVLFLGFLYFWLSGNSDALSAIGLISFAGVAQFLPAMIAALFWRSATVNGAIAATLVGFIIWAWTMLLPSFGTTSPFVADLMLSGPWGVELLRPQQLFGLSGMDPLVHSVFWSLFLNSSILIIVSLCTTQSALERIQATLFVDIFKRHSADHPNFLPGSATVNDLFFIAQRVLGGTRAYALFDEFSIERGATRAHIEPSSQLILSLEKELAGSIGAASAHVVLSTVLSGDEVSLEEVMKIADETQQAIEYSQQMEQKSAELRSTAQQLQQANEQLKQLDIQKDDFLSQVSHEVRTPMTSIRSFSEILLTHDDLAPQDRHKFTTTIHDESLRLTKLLDEILDLNNLERGVRRWDNQPTDGEAALTRAIAICEPMATKQNARIIVGKRASATIVNGEPDRLAQVFINLISNAIKYNDNTNAEIHVSSSSNARGYHVDVTDNGPGVAAADRERIFEKFSRGGGEEARNQSGSGLGLAISRQIITRMDGKLELMRNTGSGAKFRVSLPPCNPK